MIFNKVGYLFDFPLLKHFLGRLVPPANNLPDQVALPVLSPCPELAPPTLDALGAAHLCVRHAAQGLLPLQPLCAAALLVPDVVVRADLYLLVVDFGDAA